MRCQLLVCALVLLVAFSVGSTDHFLHALRHRTTLQRSRWNCSSISSSTKLRFGRSATSMVVQWDAIGKKAWKPAWQQYVRLHDACKLTLFTLDSALFILDKQ